MTVHLYDTVKGRVVEPSTPHMWWSCYHDELKDIYTFVYNEEKSIDYNIPIYDIRGRDDISVLEDWIEPIKQENTTPDLKNCTCKHSFLHSNNGCTCGAVEPHRSPI